jgi:uncharacterized protein YbaP (TraB family)
MQRRAFGYGLLTLLVAHRALTGAEPVPRLPLRLFSRRKARVYLLGFGEARDESWATSEVRRAFEASADLWLEVSHDAGAEPDAAAKREQLTHDPAGRTFFDVLEPDVRARARDYCAQLEIPLEKIEKQRPWSAFYTINGAYWSRHKPSFEPHNPEETLSAWAKQQGKPVRYEMPSQLDFARFMAALPDAAQSQYITFLLDFLDDQTAGRNSGEFGWIQGDMSAGERAVDRMRTRTPDLYRIMQTQRNAWWARTIDGLLEGGGTHFVGVGQMHVLGPDAIPARLLRMTLESIATPCSVKT